MTIDFKPGWRPTPAARPRIRLDAALSPTPLIELPVAVNLYLNMPSIGMLLNNQLGDCTIAANGHIIEGVTFFGQGTEYVVTDPQVLAAYEAVGGYILGNPSTDNGALIPDALSHLKKTGFGGHTIAGYGALNVKNLRGLKSALSQGFYVSAGMNFPNVAMTQFNTGQPWTVVPDDGGIEGGHCVVICGYDNDFIYLWTWGAVQKMSYDFFAKYFEELWPVVSREWVSLVTGKDPEGVDITVLGQEFQDVTGTNPFAVTPPASPRTGVPWLAVSPPPAPRTNWLSRFWRRLFS